ncbi:sporulation phosphorelay system protein KapB [Paenibacillus albus]|nr:sporulation phosphorelay system protein KapB [Paenibacillus albus]
MMQQEKWIPEIGTIVAFTYKSGQYAGEVMETNGPRALLKVLAVLKHPEQGDLHNPYNPDVAMFHERRALSYTEKTNVPYGDIKPFRSELPSYKDSLDLAVQAEIEAVDRLKRWAERSLEQLQQLGKEYK